MTAPFTASNGYTVEWREESDFYMTVTGKGKALGLSEYITSPVLRALIEFAEHRDIYPEDSYTKQLEERARVAQRRADQLAVQLANLRDSVATTTNEFSTTPDQRHPCGYPQRMDDDLGWPRCPRCLVCLNATRPMQCPECGLTVL